MRRATSTARSGSSAVSRRAQAARPRRSSLRSSIRSEDSQAKLRSRTTSPRWPSGWRGLRSRASAVKPKIYGIRNCDTMKKTFAWLDAKKIDYEFHDYKKDGVPPGKLKAWAARAGWERLANT